MSARLLLEEWMLERSARLRRLRIPRWVLALALLAACFAISVAIIAFARSTPGRQLARACAQHPMLVGLAALLFALLFTLRRRVSLRQHYAQSWLVPTPVPAAAYRHVIAIRVAASAVAALAMAASAMLVMLLAARHAGVAEIVLVWMTGGFAIGTLAGACWPVTERSNDREESRYVRNVRQRSAEPSLEGLARWPIAKALAWHRPEHSRVLFIVAALSVPAGVSALMGLAILAVWSLGSYVLAVARAVPAVAHEAALWLRPTVMPFRTFACAIARRAALHQLVGTTVLGGVFVVLGATWVAAAYFALLWLVLCAMSSAIGLRRSFLGLPSIARTLVSLGLALIAESRARGAGLLIATIVTLAHTGVWERERA